MTRPSSDRAERIPGHWWSPEWSLDVPVEAVGPVDVARPSPGDLATVLDRLRSSAEFLSELPVLDIAAAIGRVGERILDAELDALTASVAAEVGFSETMARRVVEGMARGWTEPALRRLLEMEFEDPAVLDGFRLGKGRSLWARGRGLTFHLGAGSVPGVTATSLVRGLLVKCPSIAKPGGGDVTLSVALLRLLWEESPSLASCAAVLYWVGGDPANRHLEDVVFGEARQIVAYGGAGTAERVRAQASPDAAVVLHGPRTGVVVATPESEPAAVAEAAAMFDQRGCVSPHLVLLLGGYGDALLRWSQGLEDALRAVGRAMPRGAVPAEVMGRLHQVRGALELRNAGGEAVVALGDHVLIAPLEDVEPLGGRVLWVVPCEDESDVADALGALGPVLQSVGIDDADLRRRMAPVAAAAGATRIVPVAELSFPPPEWIHDGRGPLRELVRWAEWS